ncbi:MAG: glycerophosphodiester phosphodiesterase family protein, partial [Verrucomicrobiota bacterium]
MSSPICFVVLIFLTVVRLISHAAPFPFFEPIQPPRPFQVIAHHGQSRQAPENTRPALQHCIDDGLEWAEVDVRLTLDGQHILSHDATVTNASGESWLIQDHSMEELRRIDVGSNFAARFAGEKLLSLQDCFALCKGHLNLYLDCKSVNPEQLAAEILAAKMERQVVVYSNLDQLAKIRKSSGAKVATMTKWRTSFGGPEWAVTNGLSA